MGVQRIKEERDHHSSNIYKLRFLRNKSNIKWVKYNMDIAKSSTKEANDLLEVKSVGQETTKLQAGRSSMVKHIKKEVQKGILLTPSKNNQALRKKLKELVLQDQETCKIGRNPIYKRRHKKLHFWPRQGGIKLSLPLERLLVMNKIS